MADATEFTIGTEARCSDGDCGKVSRVVVDPIARAVTHLVVEPKAMAEPSRLVPLALVDSAAADEVRLSCTLAEFGKLDPAEETRFLPGTPGYADYGPDQVLAWPYYGLVMDGRDIGAAGLGFAGGDFIAPVTTDKVPLGEVAVRRGEHVHATDGEIGRVQGLVIDARDNHVTHVLLQEGHLWGRKDVAIPIGAVTKVDDEGIKLKLDKQGVQDLPPVDIDSFTG
jgi:sporulation protein YlmC with PRC-barrel domain